MLMITLLEYIKSNKYCVILIFELNLGRFCCCVIYYSVFSVLILKIYLITLSELSTAGTLPADGSKI